LPSAMAEIVSEAAWSVFMEEKFIETIMERWA
jgi:hypothetical protein